MFFSNVCQIWMLLQKARDVSCIWMPPTLRPMDHCHHCIYTGVLAITALCMQYAAVVMSTPAQPSMKASWNDQGVTVLIAYLYEH